MNEIMNMKIQLSSINIEMERIATYLSDREQEFFDSVYEKEETALKAAINTAKEQFESSAQFLHTIRKCDMDELKSYNIPPPMIGQIADAICIIFDKNPTWHEAKKIIVNNTFIQKIANFDESILTKSKVERLQKYTEQPNFCTDRMVNLSVAAKGLSHWISTAVQYRWLKLHMSSNAQITAKIRRMCMAKTNKTEEKIQLDILQKKSRELEIQILSLVNQKKFKVGKFRIIDEALKEDSIFNQIDNQQDELYYRQWFQRAFYIGSEDFSFEDVQMNDSYLEYQKSISHFEDVKKKLSEKEKKVDSLLENVRLLFMTLKMDDLQTLLRISEDNPINNEAKSILHILFRINQTMAVPDIYDEVGFNL
jgi:hypothetical protein